MSNYPRVLIARSLPRGGGSEVNIQVMNANLSDIVAEAIVCPADGNLTTQGGIAFAIAQLAGPDFVTGCNDVLRARRSLHQCEVVATSSGQMLRKKVRRILHLVVPHVGQQNHVGKMRTAVMNALRLAESETLESIAIPMLGCGTLRWSTTDSADAILSAILEWLPTSKPTVKTILIFDTDPGRAQAVQTALYRLCARSEPHAESRASARSFSDPGQVSNCLDHSTVLTFSDLLSRGQRIGFSRATAPLPVSCQAFSVPPSNLCHPRTLPKFARRKCIRFHL